MLDGLEEPHTPLTNTSLTGVGLQKIRVKSHEHTAVVLVVSTVCCPQKEHNSRMYSPWIDQPLGRWSQSVPVCKHRDLFFNCLFQEQPHVRQSDPCSKLANFRREAEGRLQDKENRGRLIPGVGVGESERKQNTQKGKRKSVGKSCGPEQKGPGKGVAGVHNTVLHSDGHHNTGQLPSWTATGQSQQE